MSEWVLILFIHAGVLSGKDSMALTAIGKFQSEAACKAAGAKTDTLVTLTTKQNRYVCVERRETKR